jgi:hypothetical protein
MNNEEYSPALKQEIERYLQTGDYDVYYRAWPEGGMLHRAQMTDAVLRKALITRAQHCAREASKPLTIPEMDFTALTRSKVIPMVHGLFPQSEREVVVGVLEKSVVFLTPDSVAGILEKVSFLSTAWDLANLYLTSIGAPCLSEEAIQLEGLSEETTCFVSMRYFSQKDRFADFIVHEAAHIFHNCKRETIGLPYTCTREWLLEIDFRKRETFAYACEAYSRILELSRTGAQRIALLEEYAANSLPGNQRVDDNEIVDILAEAISARNGWKRILKHCAPQSQKRLPETIGSNQGK